MVKKNPPNRGTFSFYAAEGHDAHDPDAGQDDPLVSLFLLYPSAYQPLPLSVNALCEMSFFIGPPHFGHSFAGSSENFCFNSN